MRVQIEERRAIENGNYLISFFVYGVWPRTRRTKQIIPSDTLKDFSIFIKKKKCLFQIFVTRHTLKGYKQINQSIYI
jgi:hypothetical protein